MGGTGGRLRLLSAHTPSLDVDLPLFYQRLYGVYSTYVGAGRCSRCPIAISASGYAWPDGTGTAGRP